MKKTHVSITPTAAIASSGSGANGKVSTASLAEGGAALHNTYSGGGINGFVLELPDGLDEQEAVLKLTNHSDVMKVVPDTWVGIAAAAGAETLGRH